jgi:hypothetical protein
MFLCQSAKWKLQVEHLSKDSEAGISSITAKMNLLLILIVFFFFTQKWDFKLISCSPYRDT